VRDALRALRGLLQIRWNSLVGRYGPQVKKTG
jgi:hypothetical protein